MGFQIPNADQVSYAPIAREFASDLVIQELGNEGYYIRLGCQLVPGTTSGTVKCNAGVAVVAGSEVVVAAQDNIACAASASGSNPLWIGYEIDSTGTCNANVGSAAANPEPNAPNSARVTIGEVFVPTSASGAATATLSSSGANPIIVDKRIIQAAPPFLFYKDTAGTVVTNATSFTTLLSAAPTIPANSLNVGDTLRLRASGVMLLHTTTVVTFQILVGVHDAMVIATASLAADTSNTRKWLIDAEMICSANGSTANFKCNARQGVTISSVNSDVGLADDQVQTNPNLVAGSQDNTSGLVLDLQFKNTTSDAATTCTLHGCSIIKYPA